MFDDGPLLAAGLSSVALRMALLLCLGTFFARQACAEQPYLIELDEVQNACMGRQQLETAVLAELGSVKIPDGLRVQAEVDDNPGFILRDREEIVAERRFDVLPSHCDAQLRMLAVVIALAIEHRVARQTEQHESAVEEPIVDDPPKSSAAVSAGSIESPPEEKPDERKQKERELQKSWALRGSGGVGYSFGVIPVPAPIVSAELGVVVWRGWSVEVGVIVTDRMRIGFDVLIPEGAGARAPDEAFSQAIGQLLAGKAQGCWEPAFEDGTLGICAGLAAGRFYARGVEGFQPNPGSGVPWLAAISRFTGRVPARGPFGASLNVDIFGNLLRPGVELTGEGSVQRPVDTPVVGGAVSLGMFFVVQ